MTNQQLIIMLIFGQAAIIYAIFAFSRQSRGIKKRRKRVFKTSIKKMRKNVSSERWLRNKLILLREEISGSSKFKTFECNDFFRGYDIASLNRDIYNEVMKRNRRQRKFINKLIENKTSV